MPSFKYLGDDERVFPHVSLVVAPGEVVDLVENPDPRWFEVAKAPTTAAPKED